MGTAELCAWGIPSLLVPLPTAAADHQSVNARTLAAAGAAIYIPQIDFTVQRFEATLRDLLGRPEELARLTKGAIARARPDAALVIARHVAALIG
jgi:UDP-N-acetylglucosamine--N-acetylmuramyl-(pentapeptide) pyrophosphoryl-undecaprenol N-acetylglucosamine transferase